MSNNQPHLTCSWSSPVDWDTLSVASVPAEPGYYAFTDYPGALQPSAPGQNVLYVGIATRSLQDRIRKYKTGDTRGLANMHLGGFMMLISRATAHYGDGRLTHSVQRTPIQVTTRTANGPAQQSTLNPDSIYLRWAVDYRAAIEALLIQQLSPKYNTMLTQP
jgi:hypothetical protein